MLKLPSKPGHIRLSPKHGVNPAIPLCFFCNKEKNEILLPGHMRNGDDVDVEAPRNKVWDKVPCDECKGWMAQGVLFISVDEAKSKGDLGNPYRTGGWCVIKDEAVERLPIDRELKTHILKDRVCFVPDDAWDALGFPRGEVKPT